MRRNYFLLPLLFAGCLYTYEDSPSTSREDDAGTDDDDTSQCNGESGGGGDAAENDIPLGRTYTQAEIDGFEVCCETNGDKAHCANPPKIPEELLDAVDACGGSPGFYCIPDSVLLTGGDEDPVDCIATGEAGRCLPACLPDVVAEPGLVPNGCPSGRLCAPCIDYDKDPPEETGACDDWNDDDGGGGGGGGDMSQCNDDMGDDMMTPDGGDDIPMPCDDRSTCTYDMECGECIPLNELEPCGLPERGDAHCYSREALIERSEGADVSDLMVCPTDDTKLCVPDEILVTCGKYLPQPCRSINDSEGRCQSRMIQDVEDNDNFPQDVCAATHRCVPCYNPFDGSDTGACTTKCDAEAGAPFEPKKVYPKCCGGIGSCIEQTKFTEDEAKPLEEMECEDLEEERYYCFPDDLGMNRPGTPCTADPWGAPEYEGVCFPCMDAPEGDCPNGQACLPCLDGLDEGEPTELPGCPGFE